MLKIELNSTKQKNSNTTKGTFPRFNSLNLLTEPVDVVCRKQFLFCVNSENIVVKIRSPR